MLRGHEERVWFIQGVPDEKILIFIHFSHFSHFKYFHTGHYEKIEPSRNCISSAMNVGHPSNLARLIDLYGGIMDETGVIHRQADLYHMRNEIFPVSISDFLTRDTISEAYANHHLLLEPHGAVGWAGMLAFLKAHPEADVPSQLFVSLETAHPAKFPLEIQRTLGFDPELPPALEGLESKEERCGFMENEYGAFREYLMKKF